MKNRFMLAPLTNTQSHGSGQLSDEEYRWLTMRAEGGFGLTMTCATYVQPIGKGFPGQLGIYSDEHISGHSRLAQHIKKEGSLGVVQLHHAGMRSPFNVIRTKAVCPSASKKYNARALHLNEIEALKQDFINAAIRAKKSGYDGVEIHGAHGYILTQFLSAEINKRNDIFGGTLANRFRLLFDIVKGVREKCGESFVLGVRLSPERFGMKLDELKVVGQQLIDSGLIDFLDWSLWDFRKAPQEDHGIKKSLLQHILELDYKTVKLTVAGSIRSGKDTQEVLDKGVDFVTIGRSAILHHNFPNLVLKNSSFEPIATPVSEEYLHSQGLSTNFINYMRRWPDFVI